MLVGPNPPQGVSQYLLVYILDENITVKSVILFPPRQIKYHPVKDWFSHIFEHLGQTVKLSVMLLLVDKKQLIVLE